MPTIIRKHKPQAAVKGPATSAAEYFKAKLHYESTPHSLKQDLETGKALLLDVRDAESYKKEHIPGAESFPFAEFEKRWDSLPKDKTIVTYCWNMTCALAPKAALWLAERGFSVKELVGGIEEWRKKFPTESAR